MPGLFSDLFRCQLFLHSAFHFPLPDYLNIFHCPRCVSPLKCPHSMLSDSSHLLMAGTSPPTPQEIIFRSITATIRLPQSLWTIQMFQPHSMSTPVLGMHRWPTAVVFVIAKASSQAGK